MAEAFQGIDEPSSITTRCPSTSLPTVPSDRGFEDDEIRERDQDVEECRSPGEFEPARRGASGEGGQDPADHTQHHRVDDGGHQPRPDSYVAHIVLSVGALVVEGSYSAISRALNPRP